MAKPGLSNIARGVMVLMIGGAIAFAAHGNILPGVNMVAYAAIITGALQILVGFLLFIVTC